MVELADLYVRAAEPLLPHAQRLLAAWHDAVLPAPTAEEVAREAARVNVSAEQAERRLRYANASCWEQLGDALLFNPANFHSVEPNPGGRRIALAFFLGLTTTGQLIAWS